MKDQTTIEDLYNEKKVIKVQFVGKTHPYHINLTNPELNKDCTEFINKPDCRVTSWADNIWFRTPKGLNYGKYSSIARLKQAITFAGKSRGLLVDKFIIQDPRV